MPVSSIIHMPPSVPDLSQLAAESVSWPHLLHINVWIRGHLACLIMLASAIYCWAVVSAASPGMKRLLAGLPVLAAIHAVPLLFNHKLEPLSTISSTFLAVRLTSGKVIAFILGRGVLVLPLSLPQFMAVMLAPFMPAQLVATRLQLQEYAQQQSGQARTAASGTAHPAKQPTRQGLHTLWQQVTPMQRYSLDSNNSSNSSSSKKDAASYHPSPLRAASSGTDGVRAAPSTSLPPRPERALNPTASSSGGTTATANSSSSSNSSAANLLLNALVVAAFAAYSCSSTQRMLAVAIRLLGVWFMWKGMETLMRVASAPARDWLGMTLAPHFINPFRSSSLTDFWARRWNITQGLVLRFFVYEPIVQGRLVAPTGPTPSTVVTATAAAGNPEWLQANLAGCKLHEGKEQKPPGVPANSAAADGAAGTSSVSVVMPMSNGDLGLRYRGHNSTCHSILAAAGMNAQQHCLNAAEEQPTKPVLSLDQVAGASIIGSRGENKCSGCSCSCCSGSCSCAAAPAAEAAGGKTCSTGANFAATYDAVFTAEQQRPILPPHEDGISVAAAGSNGAAAVSNNSAGSSTVSLQVPVLAAPSAPRATRWRRQLAAAATFVVSGLEHELFLFYVTRTVGWRWFVFFSLQGVLLAVESVVKRRCSAAGLQLHPVVASLAVLLVLGLTADLYFWPPLLQRELIEPLLAAMPQQLLLLLGAEVCA